MQMIQASDTTLQSSGFCYYSDTNPIGTPQLENAFNELRVRIADLIPAGFTFEFIHHMTFETSHIPDVIVFGGKIGEANKLKAFRSVEKEFVAAVNKRFSGLTHYQTVPEMLTGELAEALNATVDEQYKNKFGIPPHQGRWAVGVIEHETARSRK